VAEVALCIDPNERTLAVAGPEWMEAPAVEVAVAVAMAMAVQVQMSLVGKRPRGEFDGGGVAGCGVDR
jgi:hypothetical protein